MQPPEGCAAGKENGSLRETGRRSHPSVVLLCQLFLLSPTGTNFLIHSHLAAVTFDFQSHGCPASTWLHPLPYFLVPPPNCTVIFLIRNTEQCASDVFQISEEIERISFSCFPFQMQREVRSTKGEFRQPSPELARTQEWPVLQTGM